MIKSEGIIVKTPSEIKIMQEGGRRLAGVKHKLFDEVVEGVSAEIIEQITCRLIAKERGKPSFKMVPGYRWATCVNINEGVVHGIPKKEIVFKKGDVVSVDLGMFYRGFHTDTSFSVGLNTDPEITDFLETGEEALRSAIKSAIIGNRIYDISFAIESILKNNGYSPVKALVGHGVGRNLHEEPQIPCFIDGAERNQSPEIPEGAVLAIEVMYSTGSADVVLDDDGWTIKTADGKISALFEETVAVTKRGPKILTF